MSQRQKPYFTATIQEETTYRDIVVFNKQQHSTVNDIATSKSPVLLMNPTIRPALNNPKELSVLVGSSTLVDIIPTLHFIHQQPSTRMENTTMTIVEILAKPRNRQQVNIQDIRGNTTRWLQHECREIQMSTYSVADSTASILLTTWNNMDLSINTWYTLSPVTIRDFKNTISVSTTPSTTAETINRPPRHAVAAPVMDNSEEVTGLIIGAMTTSTITCPKRHPLPNCPPGAPFHMCPTCNQHYITPKLRHQWNVTLTLEINDTTTRELKMEHTVVLNTAPKHIYLDTDPITVTGHFLSIGCHCSRTEVGPDADSDTGGSFQEQWSLFKAE
ncbi:uncharacterized protein LOC124488073 [Hypomesus transpacificus]|uniref:uncharacterized protein LOC124488073 n=1 Tax=Hypomesus transpacificus TaxID=137520 RepID=UPI001F079C36|nr:uncharacterized protein LOC124488073 [Hypomesus transpacificus]XP_046906502.1 uncharacterized protein LOC124488073 [Hypomesus transpacificus]